MAELDDMLRKVQALLAKADDPATTVPEAEAFREGAERLMQRYRIDEAMLNEAKPLHLQIHPTWREWTVCSTASEYASEHRGICSSVLAHFDLRGVFKTGRSEEGSWVWVVEAVGYDSDLRMAEVLHTSFAVAFGSRVEPKVDPKLPDSVNAYALRLAGMEGRRIADALYGPGSGDNKTLRSKVRRMFKDEAIRRGESPERLLGATSVKQFRRDFASSFETEVWSRLARMRRSLGEASQAMVLRDRVERVNEAFYERHPTLRPASGSNEPYRAPNHGCERCAKAKSGYCKEHAWLKPSRARAKTTSTNWSAIDRGREAARSVDIGDPGRTVDRT